jgi:uncharacterized membrane protein
MTIKLAWSRCHSVLLRIAGVRLTRRLEISLSLAIGAIYSFAWTIEGWLAAESFALPGGRDWSVYQSALWQAGQFENPVSYVLPGISQLTFVGGHFMPIGFVYGLVYRFFPSIHTTILITAVSFALSGFFVCLLVDRITQNAFLAIAFQIVYLAVFTPALRAFYLDDWATPFLAAGLYFLVSARYGWATAMWLVAMMFKEYFGLAIAVFGLACWLPSLYSFVETRVRHLEISGWSLLWRDSRSRFGLLWTVIGVFWFLIAFFGVMKWFQPSWPQASQFSELGDSPSSITAAIFSSPAIIVAKMVAPPGREYLFGLFLPLAFLPLLGIEYTVALAPILFLNFLANGEQAVRDGMNGHYVTWAQPFLIAGAVIGIVRLKGWLDSQSNWLRVATTAILGAIIVVYAVQGIRFHFYKLRESLVSSQALAAHAVDVRSALSLIPNDASVAADESLMPFLSNRRILVHMQNIGSLQPEYIVRDTFYGQGLSQAVAKGFALGWKLYDYPPSYFYDSQAWEKLPPAACDCVGYAMVDRIGSLTLFRRN